MAGPSDPIATFRAEVEELFEQLETALLDLESDPTNKDLIDQSFRALHTIKGSGAMFGFDAASAFAHHVENAFDQVRKGHASVSRELIEVVLRSRDHIRALIEAPAEADPAEGAALLERLAAAMGANGTGAAASTAVRAVPKTYRIHMGLPRSALETGTNPLLLLDELRRLGSFTPIAITDGVPRLEEMEPLGCYLSWDCVLTTDQPTEAIEDVFIFVRDDMELRIEEIPPEARRLGEILVEREAISAEALTSALKRQERIGSLLVKAGTVSGDALAAALAEQGHMREAAEKAARRENSAIRVPAERLDELMDQVGELVIAQARLRQLADDEFSRHGITRSQSRKTAGNVRLIKAAARRRSRHGLSSSILAGSEERKTETAVVREIKTKGVDGSGRDIRLRALVEEIERLASELRDTTMNIRMVPIGSLFGRFRRLIRDLSRELGKEVRLTTSGEETEIDKTVIERLHDPLVHLIRNAVDHGIETPAEREAAGKPIEGHVHLSAIHSGAHVHISIRDDGRGIDPAAIRTKAEEMGLIQPGAEASEQEIFQFIFHPGFSTAGKITNVSGRGVGMDVVRRAIDALRGTIEVSSTLGRGATLSFKLPLTLAIIDGLLVRVGTQRYVIPLSVVDECVELRAEGNGRTSGIDFLNIRGETVPFLRLRTLFHVDGETEKFQKIVIVSAGGGRIGLVVDQLLGNYQTVIKSLSRLHADVGIFSGATILGDGAVALILDVPRLIDLGQGGDGAAALIDRGAVGREPPPPTQLPAGSMEVLTLGLSGEAFAVEAAAVREILDLVSVTDVPNAPGHARGLVNVRGKVVPLVDLRVRFGMEPTTPTIDTRVVVIEVTIDDEPEIVGFLADKVHEVARIDAAAIEVTPRVGIHWRSEFIRGVGRRGADFLFILDINRIFVSDQQTSIGDGIRGGDRARPDHAD